MAAAAAAAVTGVELKRLQSVVGAPLLPTLRSEIPRCPVGSI